MIGFGFAAHGYAKLNRGPENFAIILRSLGVPQPHVMAWVTDLALQESHTDRLETLERELNESFFSTGLAGR